MKNPFLLYAKGLAMGAADVVPGVSGGTVAFISGIYDELLGSLSRIPEATVMLLRGRIREAWSTANLGFLLVLMAGVLTSIFSLARLITWLLETHPIAVWAFFFGLILVSAQLMARDISRWNGSRLFGLALGAAFGYWVSMAAPVQVDAAPLTLFLAGAIAICAMILPGISGSFILLLMGLYTVVLGAVRELDIALLAIFASGCVVGLLSFARLLSWTLERYRDLTLVTLIGLMLGSLNKVWPWKQTLAWQEGAHGERIPLVQENLLPARFAELNGQDPQLLLAIALAIGGVLLVLGLEQLAGSRRHTQEING